MYRVLIVDDEPIAIDSIEYIIRNNFRELEVGGRARSGREAIEKAYNIRPDIVLIDIKMPGINGLEAIRKIRDSNSEVYFIVISAYDYFDYAAEAMALGVVEYLLKPVREGKLIEALKKVINIIEQKRKRISRELELKEKLEIIVPTLESGFIHTICMPEDNTEELVNFSRLFELENKGGYVMAIEFGDRDRGGIQNKISVSVKTQNHYVDYRDILKSMCRCIVGPIMLNRLMVYVLNDPPKNDFDFKTSAIKLAEEFSARARSNIGGLSIGIGRYYGSVLDAKKSYHEAMQALHTISSGDETILHIDDLIRECEECPDFEEKLEQEVYSNASKGDINSTLLVLDKILNQIAKKAGSPDTVKDQCILLTAGFARHMGSMSRNFHAVLNKIMGAGDYKELRNTIRNYVERIVNELSVNRQKKINSIIGKADSYMGEHYAEDISLDDIARVVNLSPYYFSRFYKEESGINFIDRLIAVRIEKAKRYFETTDLSLKEISGLVGYADPNYFSKLFKKMTGYTATEYKEYYRK